jgi:DNA-binding IclR family transcriptional regulator
LVDQHPESGKYQLGFGVLALSDLRLRQTDLRTSAAPHLRLLRDELNETVVLCIRVGDDRVHIDVFEATRPVRRVAYVGERIPLYAGAAGKVLLAAMDPQEFEDYLVRTRLDEMGPNTITSADELRRQVQRTRQTGYATGRAERAEEGAGIAVPIFGRSGNVVAALHVLLPGTRFTREAQTRILARLKDVSETIGKSIGWNGQPSGFPK